MNSVKHLRNALVFLMVAIAVAFAQTAPTATNPTPTSPAATATANATDVPEISTQEQAPSFQVKVNLVEVRVVVRDAQGKAVGSLTQNDFVLLDDKKPQTITRFSVEQNAQPSAASTPQADASSAQEVKSHLAGSWRVAYLFDDFHSTPNNLSNARKAADQAIDALAPGQQLAIYTLSGQGTQDFTDDKQLLHAAVARLQPRPQGASGPGSCPAIDHYIADQIINSNDRRALEMVRTEVIACQFEGNTVSAGKGGGVDLQTAETFARQAAEREVNIGESQDNIAFQTIIEVTRRIGSGPGQHIMVFLSPGFYISRTQQAALTEALNRAIRAGVVVNTVDLRGAAPTSIFGTDTSERASGSAYESANMIQYKQDYNQAQTDSLLQMSNATGGKTLRNNNDFSGGLASLTALPEFSYLLGFAPPNLQNDGKFHTLKVELKQPSGYTVQARKGYYAPFPGGSSEQGKREVAEAVFSHDEIRELPMRVQTQFFKSGDDTANVIVLVHVDVRRMQFKKADGRNLNDLTVVAALFDRNENLVNAKSSTVKMHIKDQTLETKLGSGVTVKNVFEVKPGGYMVRVVARDEQGKMLTQNEVVDIP